MGYIAKKASLNNKGSLVCGPNLWLRTAQWATTMSSAPSTLIIVGEFDQQDGNHAVLDGLDETSFYQFYTNSTAGVWNAGTQDAAYFSTVDNGVPGVDAVIFEATQDSWYYNFYTQHAGHTGINSTNTVKGLTIGAFYDNSGGTSGFYISEIIIYNKKLSQAEQEAAMVGLGVYYGIPVTKYIL